MAEKSMKEKLSIIVSDVVPKSGAKIEVLSTSMKITHACGCVLVRHFAPGKPHTLFREQDPEKYDEIYYNRKYWIELCEEHRNVNL